MKIHNLMEEFVASRVNALYDTMEREKPAWLHCSCEECRMDAISYVLNRVTPRYIVSGRGFVHNADLFDNATVCADVDALVMEGVRLINAAFRPYHKGMQSMSMSNVEECAFNFPVFIGNVLDGSAAEPLSDVTVLLLINGDKAQMLDKTWDNPCMTYKATHGKYSFWVQPIACDGVGHSGKFTFTLKLKHEGYLPMEYTFDLTIVSEKYKKMEMDSSYSLKVQDIFMSRVGI